MMQPTAGIPRARRVLPVTRWVSVVNVLLRINPRICLSGIAPDYAIQAIGQSLRELRPSVLPKIEFHQL